MHRNTHSHVLQLDLQGTPQAWISLEQAAVHVATGSVAWVDNRGMMRVGPTSAGAAPGPVAYGRGGSQPTVTDAALVLGLIDPDYFLGGAIRLDRSKAAAAIETGLAQPLGVTTEEAAVGIYRTISANMGNALRNVTIEKGYDPREFVLVAYGGCSSLFIANISRELNIRSILIPERAAVFSAFGACVADVKRDVAQTYYHALPLDITDVNAALGTLKDAARGLVLRDGIEPDAISVACEADMRIHGQIWEITVPLPSEPLSGEAGNATIYDAFRTEYARKYGEGLVGDPSQCDVLNLRVVATGSKPKPEMIRFEGSAGKEEEHTAVKASRLVFLPETGAWNDVDIIDGQALRAGITICGPAVVERKNTTIYVPPDWNLKVDEYHNCRLAYQA